MKDKLARVRKLVRENQAVIITAAVTWAVTTTIAVGTLTAASKVKVTWIDVVADDDDWIKHMDIFLSNGRTQRFVSTRVEN
jgi:hypothetical protein